MCGKYNRDISACQKMQWKSLVSTCTN